jgi:hypothetical protein
MAPSVRATLLATPSLRLAPTPTGHSIAASNPIFDFHSGLALAR